MRINKVEYFKNYKLKIWFSDKKIKIVDLEDELKKAKGVFIPLKNLDYFKEVFLDSDQISICWPNGADICPDFLYKIGKEARKQKQKIIKPKRTLGRRKKHKQAA